LKGHFPGRMQTHRKVMITGRGVVSPLGVGLQAHTEGLLTGRSVISRLETLSSLGVSLSAAGKVPEGDLVEFVHRIPRKQKKLMNRAGVLAGVASALAVEEAGFGLVEMDPTRSGIFLATWFTAYELLSFIRYLGKTESEDEPKRLDSEKANRHWTEDMNPVDYSLKVLPNLTAGHLAILHQAQGYSRLIVDGWRGGILAVSQAAETIRHGDLDVAVVGGAEASLEEGILCDLATFEVMAKDGKDPDRVCRPFDVCRGGSVVGEGAGVVVLEEKEHAENRGATIYGEVVGSASSAPGREDKGEGALIRSMNQAMADAKVSPDEIDLIHANGDSTSVNDRAEFLAISDVFGSGAHHLPITATKSLHGHLLSAAGAVELISSLIMLEHGVIPPIVNCDCPDPECNLDLVRDRRRENQGMSTVLLNAVGLFGEAASLVIRR